MGSCRLADASREGAEVAHGEPIQRGQCEFTIFGFLLCLDLGAQGGKIFVMALLEKMIVFITFAGIALEVAANRAMDVVISVDRTAFAGFPVAGDCLALARWALNFVVVVVEIHAARFYTRSKYASSHVVAPSQTSRSGCRRWIRVPKRYCFDGVSISSPVQSVNYL